MTITAMVAGCAGTNGTKEIGAPASTAPRADHKPVLFYAKGGSWYVSDPAGTPGRKLTDGPGDFQPAPSPDGRRLAFVRKVPHSGPMSPCTGGELWVLDLAADGRHRVFAGGRWSELRDGTWGPLDALTPKSEREFALADNRGDLADIRFRFSDAV
jgi:hypothetical protein